MKLPSLCPFCHAPMITDYRGDYYIIKCCRLKIDHYILFEAKIDPFNEEIVYRIKLRISDKILIVFHFNSKIIEIIHKSKISEAFYQKSDIPFFEPDLSDHKKLINKIKTYLLFS